MKLKYSEIKRFLVTLWVKGEEQMNKNLLNFGIGLLLGCIAVFMWEYSKFLYYSVFAVQTIIIYILINYNIPNEIGVKK